MFSKERVQRFSIRKLTIGVASVLIGISFMTKMNTNKVYADSTQIVSEHMASTNSENQNGEVVNSTESTGRKDELTSQSALGDESTNSQDQEQLETPKNITNDLIEGQQTDKSQKVDGKDNQLSAESDKIIEITSNTPKSEIPKNINIDPKSLCKEAHLTVNYKNSDGTDFTAPIPENHTQTLTFKGKAYYDLVTGKLVNAKYVQDAKITVRYLDGTKNFKVLDQKVVDGEIGDKIDYDVNAEIQKYENMGYALDSNGYTAGDSFTEDNNGKTYDIIFRHATASIIPGTPDFPFSLLTSLMAVPSSTSKMEVPGHWVLDTDNHDEPKIHWNYDTQSFAKVISPDEDHYYVKEIISDDKKDYRNGNNVDAISVNRDEITSPDNIKSITLTVTYAPKRKINVKFIDDTTKQELSGYNKNFNEAKPGGSLNDYDTSDAIKMLEAKNYVLVSDGFTDAKLNNQMPDEDKTYEVHLVHGATPKLDTKKVNLNVTYQAEDGSDFNGDAPKEAHQTVDFTGTYYVDAVTGKEDKVNAKQLNGKWVVDSDNTATPATKWNDETKSFTKAISPQKDHYYVADITSDDQINHRTGDDVNEIDDLTHDSNDINVVVKYAIKHNINVHYIDDNPTEQQDLSSYDWKLEAKPGDVLNYTTNATIRTLEAKGYKLEDGVGKGNQFTTAMLDGKMPNADGVYNVYLVHTTTTVTPKKPGTPGQSVDPKNPDGPKYPDGTDEDSLKRTGTQIVHYVGAGDQTPKDDNQSFDFTRTITFDNVTDKIIETTPWNKSSHTFDTVKTKVISGYYADKANAGGTTITPEDLNKKVIVTYAPNGKIIPVGPNHNPIPNVPQPQYLTDPKNPSKDGSQTIHYVYSDGKPAANDSVQNTQFEHTLVFDNVTGKQIEDRGWSPESHKFNDVTSPTIDGYHADKTSVEGARVTLDNPTSEITVVYTKNSETGKANGTVTYIDDETTKTLRTDMLAGNVGEKIAYTTQDKIEEFGQEGYKLVSNSFQDGQEVFAKEGNNFIVHLKKASAPQPNPHKDDPTPQPDPEPQSNPDHDVPKPNTPKDSSSQLPKNAPQTSNHKNDQPEKPSCLSDPKQKPYTQASNKSDEKKALKERKNTPVVKKHVNKSIKKVVSHKKAAKTEKIETKTSTKVVSNDPKIAAKPAERCAMIQGNDKKLPQTGEADNVLGLIGLMIVSLTGISIFDVDRKRN